MERQNYRKKKSQREKDLPPASLLPKCFSGQTQSDLKPVPGSSIAQ